MSDTVNRVVVCFDLPPDINDQELLKKLWEALKASGSGLDALGFAGMRSMKNPNYDEWHREKRNLYKKEGA